MPNDRHSRRHDLGANMPSGQGDIAIALDPQNVAANSAIPATPAVAALPTLLKPAEVADLFGVSSKTIRRWTDAGTLNAIKVGGSVRYVASDVSGLIRIRLTASLVNRSAG